jgi:hypothetical protein
MFVVEIVKVDVAPAEVGVIEAGEKRKVPHGDVCPEAGMQTEGLGELLTLRVTGTATPLVSLAVIVAVKVEPALIDDDVGDAIMV